MGCCGQGMSSKMQAIPSVQLSGKTVELVYKLPSTNVTVFGPVTGRRYRVTMNKKVTVLEEDKNVFLAMRDNRRKIAVWEFPPPPPKQLKPQSKRRGRPKKQAEEPAEAKEQTPNELLKDS